MLGQESVQRREGVEQIQYNVKHAGIAQRLGKRLVEITNRPPQGDGHARSRHLFGQRLDTEPAATWDRLVGGGFEGFTQSFAENRQEAE